MTTAFFPLLAGLSLLAISEVGFAENPKNDTSLEPKFGELEKAQSLLGRKVVGLDGDTVGAVKDLVLDLETGHAALAVIEIGSDSAFIALPIVVLQNDGDRFRLRPIATDESFAAARSLDIESLPTVFNRVWAMVEYSTFGSKPYWAESQLANQADFDAESYRLSLLTKLQQQPVLDESGKKVGRIEDFAVSPESGLIAYAAVRLSGDESDKQYPLPLGSFVVPQANQPWTVELSEEVIRKTPSLSANQWPTRLDRGWVEYVHVRYGRSPLSGVQHKQHDEPKK